MRGKYLSKPLLLYGGVKPENLNDVTEKEIEEARELLKKGKGFVVRIKVK